MCSRSCSHLTNGSVSSAAAMVDEKGALRRDAYGAAERRPGKQRSSGKRTQGSLRRTMGDVAADALVMGSVVSRSLNHCA